VVLIAERLRKAAEVILHDQEKREGPFSRAVDAAYQEALTIVTNAPGGVGRAKIHCEPPNYLPGQLLYAFAMENALKGLQFARSPGLISSNKLSRSIKTHNLIELANGANFLLFPQETPVLMALTHISEWTGRYPVASGLGRYRSKDNPIPLGLDPDALLDWGSQHPIMRVCFDRMIKELETLLPTPPDPFGSVAVRRETLPRRQLRCKAGVTRINSPSPVAKCPPYRFVADRKSDCFGGNWRLPFA
jgi:hypothetical protein